MTDLLMQRSADISDDGLYRYLLTRRWEATSRWHLPVVMLNPSTADAYEDDRTIGRVIRFAKREGARGVTVANLYAFRATDPKLMFSAIDPVGVDNDAILDGIAIDSAVYGVPILCAWGSNPRARERAGEVARRLMGHGARLVCLGTTKSGAPKHPLYQKSDTPFMPWSPS